VKLIILKAIPSDSLEAVSEVNNTESNYYTQFRGYK
jgi:hypothetical protein